MLPVVPASASAFQDLIELCQRNAVADEHYAGDDTYGDGEAHKTSNLLTDKKRRI